jgi:hypothetical protein
MANPEFMVTIVWDLPVDMVESGYEEAVSGAWVGTSHGRLVTRVPVTAETLSAAFESANLLTAPYAPGGKVRAMSVESVSAAPHFALCASISCWTCQG